MKDLTNYKVEEEPRDTREDAGWLVVIAIALLVLIACAALLV